MSLIFCDGVDDLLGSLGKWDAQYTGTYHTTAQRNGTTCYALSDQANGRLIRYLGPDEHATITVGAVFKSDVDSSAFSQYTNTYGHITFISDTNVTKHIRVVFDGGAADPKVKVYLGSGTGTLLGESIVPVWTANTYFHVEAQCVLHDTTGSVVVKINGTTYINLTGIDTKNGGTKSVIDTVAIVNIGSNRILFVDDIYMTNGAGSVNTGFLGDVAIETLYPSGDGSSSQWVGSDGNSVNNSLLVDETTPAPGDYVESATAGNRDLYAYSNLVRTGGTVFGVMVTAYAHKADSGPVSIKNVVKSGATTLAGAARALVTTFRPESTVFETNPDTSAAWTVSEINGMEAGVEVA